MISKTAKMYFQITNRLPCYQYEDDLNSSPSISSPPSGQRDTSASSPPSRQTDTPLQAVELHEEVPPPGYY